MQVDYYDYKLMDFTCKKCGWQGKGEALSKRDFSEASLINHLDCPKCFEPSAFCHAPLIEDRKTNNLPNKFHLRVYDNCHYMNEDEGYDHGQFDTYKEARVAAKSIVEEFFVNNWKKGKTADNLNADYCMFGEDPVISPNANGTDTSFSGRKYAELVFSRLISEKEK